MHPRVDRRNWSLVCFKKNHWSIIRDASTKRVWIISNQLAVEMRHSPVQCKCIGDNCLPKRRSLLVVYIQFGYSADTVACNTFVDRVGAGAQAVAENEASRVLAWCLAAWNFDKHLVNSDCCWGFCCVCAQIGNYSHLAHIPASLTFCLALPCMKWTCFVVLFLYIDLYYWFLVTCDAVTCRNERTLDKLIRSHYIAEKLLV